MNELTSLIQALKNQGVKKISIDLEFSSATNPTNPTNPTNSTNSTDYMDPSKLSENQETKRVEIPQEMLDAEF